MRIRPGCFYCFGTLDPTISTEQEHPFVACLGTKCGRLYHQQCWQQIKQCCRCQQTEARPTTVPPPGELPPPRLRRSLPIKPAAVRYLLRGRLLHPLQVWIAALGGLAALVLAVVLIVGGVYMSRTVFAPPNALVLGEEGEAPPEQPTVTPLPPTETPPPPPTPTVIAAGPGLVQTSDVNLRAAAGHDQPILAVLQRGTTVQILEASQIVGDSVWVNVEARGQTGWINQRYLASADASESSLPRARVVGVAPGHLLVRTVPSTKAEIVARLSEGVEVALLERSENEGHTWQRIRVDQTEGWVSESYLRPIP